METQVEQPIYSEGKTTFKDATDAIDTQLALLAAGFMFESENQQPRTTAHGVMWRREWIKGRWKMTIRTAANESVFRAYGAHRKESIYNDGVIPTVNNEPGRKKVFEVARAQKAYIEKVVTAICTYLTDLGYNINATRKGAEAQEREEAWTAFIHLLKEIKPDFKHSQLRATLKNKFKGAPDGGTLLRFYQNHRPDWLKVSEVLAKL